jgi:hypothetical protein
MQEYVADCIKCGKKFTVMMVLSERLLWNQGKWLVLPAWNMEM